MYNKNTETYSFPSQSGQIDDEREITQVEGAETIRSDEKAGNRDPDQGYLLAILYSSYEGGKLWEPAKKKGNSHALSNKADLERHQS